MRKFHEKARQGREFHQVPRAKEQLVVVGHRAAVHRCVDNNPAVQRHTLLAERLRERARG